MRSRDVVMGQRVKIMLSEKSKLILPGYSGRLGIVVDIIKSSDFNIGVSVSDLEPKYFSPRELQAR